MEIKLPEGFDNREDAIGSLIQKDFEAAETELCVIKTAMESFLLKNKGYSSEDIEREMVFDLIAGNEKTRSIVDFIIRLNSKRLMIVKCCVGALVSRERHAVACARVIDSYQIPFAVVTDGNDAEVLDTLTGKVISEGLENIPSKTELLDKTNNIEFKELAQSRLEKEKRILLAFDAIKCSISHGE